MQTVNHSIAYEEVNVVQDKEYFPYDILLQDMSNVGS